MKIIFKLILSVIFSLPGACLWGWAFDNEKVGVAVFITSIIPIFINFLEKR